MKQALSLISRIREIGNSFIVSKLKEIGHSELAPSHGDILIILFKHNKITMKEISDKIHRTKATVSVLIDKLEKAQLVMREKSDEDSRNTFVVLTEKGKSLEPFFNEISNELNSYLYKGFTEEEAAQLDNLLRKMLNNG